nr:hypothetical protein [Candidatus Gracilibacteria bacterium]
MIEINLTYGGEHYDIEIDGKKEDIVVGDISGKVGDIISLGKNLVLTTYGINNYEIEGNDKYGNILNFIFLLFIYDGKLFLGLLQSAYQSYILVHLLKKEGTNLNDISGEYVGSNSMITSDNLAKIRVGKNIFHITNETLNNIDGTTSIPGVLQSKCTIRV